MGAVTANGVPTSSVPHPVDENSKPDTSSSNTGESQAANIHPALNNSNVTAPASAVAPRRISPTCSPAQPFGQIHPGRGLTQVHSVIIHNVSHPLVKPIHHHHHQLASLNSDAKAFIHVVGLVSSSLTKSIILPRTTTSTTPPPLLMGYPSDTGVDLPPANATIPRRRRRRSRHGTERALRAAYESLKLGRRQQDDDVESEKGVPAIAILAMSGVVRVVV
ncbi:hypothetical protein DFJ77DRAFT_464255 [Powellomyces hirtus]|nr:hypothetical protein DFJ77DRAFT_464255 [Powellomyces hirtus]